MKEQKTYLALGDSYTIGEAVLREESFPYQLVSRLAAGGLVFREPKVIAVTGWTTINLKAGIEAANLSAKFDLVTLLIGVNNQYQGLPPDRFRREFKELLSSAISFSKNSNKGVIVLSIPDWGLTPFGKNRDSETISTEIDLFNKVCQEESLKAGVSIIDITQVSREALSDPGLTAADGLHPSAKMYSKWVDLIVPLIEKA